MVLTSDAWTTCRRSRLSVPIWWTIRSWTSTCDNIRGPRPTLGRTKSSTIITPRGTTSCSRTRRNRTYPFARRRTSHLISTSSTTLTNSEIYIFLQLLYIIIYRSQKTTRYTIILLLLLFSYLCYFFFLFI